MLATAIQFRLTPQSFERVNLTVASYIRTNRLFTVDESVIIYVAAKITDTKLAEVHGKIRMLFAEFSDLSD